MPPCPPAMQALNCTGAAANTTALEILWKYYDLAKIM